MIWLYIFVLVQEIIHNSSHFRFIYIRAKAKTKAIFFFDVCRHCCRCSINTQIGNNGTGYKRRRFRVRSNINEPLRVLGKVGEIKFVIDIFREKNLFEPTWFAPPSKLSGRNSSCLTIVTFAGNCRILISFFVSRFHIWSILDLPPPTNVLPSLKSPKRQINICDHNTDQGMIKLITSISRYLFSRDLQNVYKKQPWT